jgi:Subtilase family
MTPLDVARFYGFPDSRGGGQTIAVIEVGGGYLPSDLEKYWTAIGVVPPFALVESMSVTPGGLQQTTPPAPSRPPRDVDGEVNGDIAVAGAIAPDSRILAVFTERTEFGMWRAVREAIGAGADILSLSLAFQESDSHYSLAALLHQAFEVAAHVDMTVLVASGDVIGQVNYPATDPFVLACGGTNLTVRTGEKYPVETPWNWGGGQGASGGVSELFAPAQWQFVESGLMGRIPTEFFPPGGRGVPDVAGFAAGYTGLDDALYPSYTIGGQVYDLAGTSMVAPLYAGLVASINSASNWGPVGHLNPLLYASASASIVRPQNTENLAPLDFGWNGPNGTGLGSLRGTNLLAAINGSSPLTMVWKGVSGDEGLYRSVLGQGMWSPPRGLDYSSGNSPAYSDGLLCWTDAITRQICYAIYDGTGWSGQFQLEGASSYASPTVYAGSVYWLGDDSTIQIAGPLSATSNATDSYRTGISSADSPAIAPNSSFGAIWVWRNYGDNEILWATQGAIDAPVEPIQSVGTKSDYRPALATAQLATENRVPMRTESTVETTCIVYSSAGIAYWAVLNAGTASWTEPAAIPGLILNSPPSLASVDGILYLTWTDARDDLMWAAFDGTTWTFPRVVPGLKVSAAPSIDCSDDNTMVLVARGSIDSSGLIWMNSGGFSSKQWGAQDRLPGFGTSSGPALAALEDRAVMIWKGIEGDTAIWSSTLVSTKFGAQSKLGNFAKTDTSPACVTVGDKVVAAWKNASDLTIKHAAWDGSTWKQQSSHPQFETSTSPALTAIEKGVFMAWRDKSTDEIWYSTSDGSSNWQPQNLVSKTGTSTSPAVATLNGVVLVAWKGSGDDERIWYTEWDGVTFTNAHLRPNGAARNTTGARSSVGPSLVTVGQVVYMTWKGAGTDEGIYTSIWDGVHWFPPQAVAGDQTSFRPGGAVINSPTLGSRVLSSPTVGQH